MIDSLERPAWPRRIGSRPFGWFRKITCAMDTIVPCPQCQRRLRISADHLGKKLKCPACGQVILTDKPETTSHRSAPATGGTSNLKGMRTGAEERNKSLSGSRSAKSLKAGPADSDPGAGVGRKSQPVKFLVRVKHDPDRILKGGYLAELGPCRLILHRGKKQFLEVPLPARAHYLGGNQFWITVAKRDVTFTLASVYQYREGFARCHRAAERSGNDLEPCRLLDSPIRQDSQLRAGPRTLPAPYLGRGSGRGNLRGARVSLLPRQRGNLPPKAAASRLANRGRAGPQHAEQRGVHHALRGASQGSPRQDCRCRETRAADPERQKPNDTHRDRAGAGLESSRDHRRGAPRDPCHHAATSSTCTRDKS